MNRKMLLLLMLLFPAADLTVFAGPSQSQPQAVSPPGSSLTIGLEKPTQAPPSLNPAWECDSAYQKGDCNRNGKLTLEDVTRLLNAIYLNSSGTYCPPCLADMNCDQLLTALDAVWFVRFFFAFGRAPLNCP